MKTLYDVQNIINTNGAPAFREYRKAVLASVAALEEIVAADVASDRTPAQTVAAFVERIGYGEAAAIVATLVNGCAWDGRISRKNAVWAASIENALNSEAADFLRVYSDRIHRAHLDQIADAMREYTPTEPTTEAEAEPEAPATSYIISENARFGSVEIKFSAKPSEATRDALKALKFRWNGKRGLWYGFATVEAVRAALDGENAQEQTICNGTDAEPSTGRKAARKTNKPDQDRIRIYYNGIKLDGGSLVKCRYYVDRDSGAVTIYADSYGASLPRDLLQVKNETDSMTDYFETDQATVDPGHPIHRYFLYAAKNADAKFATRQIERINKRIAERPSSASAYADDLNRYRAQLDAFKAEKDPGQPTAADLAEIDRARQEAENAEREAEQKARIEERERVLRLRVEGREYIESVQAAHPVKEGAPTVEITFSENPAFSSWAESTDRIRIETTLRADGTSESKTIVEEPRRRLFLSVPAAEIVLKHFDEEKRMERGGYDKTDFLITWTDENGEKSTYEGRYDLGDGDGGLIAHIRAWGEWQRTHDNYGHEKPEPDEGNAYIEFADYLATFCTRYIKADEGHRWKIDGNAVTTQELRTRNGGEQWIDLGPAEQWADDLIKEIEQSAETVPA